MNEIIRIDEVEVREDGRGRFCLNDLHRAAGGEGKHQPSNFLRLDMTQGLCAEIRSSDLRNDPVSVLQGGAVQGTYVCRELVYAYAMWVSPAFHLKVIRTFDALVTPRSGGYQEPHVPLGRYVAALERVIELQQQLLQARPVSVPGTTPPRASDPQRIAKPTRREHPWVPTIRAWAQDNPTRVEVTSTDVIGDALGLGVVTSRRQQEVGYAMRALGWKRARRKTNGAMCWVYLRPGGGDRTCTCAGRCKGTAGLAPGWKCALEQRAVPGAAL